MAKINGVEVGSISKIMGKESSSITNIMGIKTSEIPGWPGQTPTCESLMLGYQSTPPIATVCSQEPSPYEFDSNSNILYVTCGDSLATTGFYSDGRYIYSWNSESLIFEIVDQCITYPTFSNLTNIGDSEPPIFITSSWQFSNQENTTTAIYRFIPSINIELYYKISTINEYPYNGNYDSTPPKYLTPPFIFLAGEISVNSGEFISLSFENFDLPPSTPVVVVVEVKVGRDVWQEIGSFTCVNTTA